MTGISHSEWNKTKSLAHGVCILVTKTGVHLKKIIRMSFSNSAVKKIKQGNGMENDGYD